jgi:methenyltetrahydrofolate cyclohydrolase
MRDETLGTFLDRLAAREPAPGGGATAALHAAQAAALLAMVARYSDGPKYAEHAAAIDEVLTAADILRGESLDLVAADAAAFGSVAAAYALPRDTDEGKAARSAAIAAALVTAAGPPADVIGVSARLTELAEALTPIGNRNVISDVAAAAEAIRAAAATARINVEVNLPGITNAVARDRYAAALAGVDALLARADAISNAVRAELAR